MHSVIFLKMSQKSLFMNNRTNDLDEVNTLLLFIHLCKLGNSMPFAFVILVALIVFFHS